MVEIHAERVWISPKLASLDVQPERSRQQLGKIVGLAGKTDDDIRLEAPDTWPDHVGDHAERRLLRIIRRRLIQGRREFTDLPYPPVQRKFVEPNSAQPGE